MAPRRDARQAALAARDEKLAADIREALSKSGGNRMAAAERLGMPRRTLYRWLARLGLEDYARPASPPVPRRRAG